MEHRAWMVCVVILAGGCEKNGQSWVSTAGDPLVTGHQSKVLLGKALFFDPALSEPEGQPCAVCHGPEVGWTGPHEDINAHGAVYEGAVPGRFGNRKPPSSAYATPSPILHFFRERGETVFVGGSFWDGRATGERLGDPAADQAQGPFLNPVEQNNPTPRSVCQKVRQSDFAEALTGIGYRRLFRMAFGPGSLDCMHDSDGTYDRIALAIAAYEGSPEVNAFSSKYDAHLAGEAELTVEEEWGLELFEGKALCSTCHTSRPGAHGTPPLFTDYTYDNLGVPRNPENPFYEMPLEINPFGEGWVDSGLGGFLSTRPDYERFAGENMGKQKVPTLRNVDKRPHPDFVKAYTHNGYFKTLYGIVHFYNTRDVLPTCDGHVTEEDALAHGCWPLPELDVNVNTDQLGNLGLTYEEELAIVAFMKTLSDGYEPH